MPFDDPAVDALPDALRGALARHWHRRARSEARVGAAFTLLIPRLRAVDAAPVVLDLLALGASDERAHSELCHKLAERYAGERLEAAGELAASLPVFGCDDERLEMALLVTGMCCVNETIATSWLRANLLASRTPLARFVNRVHLRDEIDHARLGWAHLASAALDEPLREALATCVPRLLAANLPGWLRPDEALGPDAAPEHGVASLCDARDAALVAVRDAVVPGFAHVGVRLDAQALAAVNGLLADAQLSASATPRSA